MKISKYASEDSKSLEVPKVTGTAEKNNEAAKGINLVDTKGSDEK